MAARTYCLAYVSVMPDIVVIRESREVIAVSAEPKTDVRCRCGVHLYVLGRADIPEERGHPYEQCVRCGRRREAMMANGGLHENAPGSNWPGQTGI